MPELEVFLSRYGSCFGRQTNLAHARRLLHGLLAGTDRRNVENMAEAIEGGVVRTLQKFLGQGTWSDQEVLCELREHVTETLGDEDAVLIVDETGFAKKGIKSVGVARQYSGTLGRVDNCQIGVFLSYASPQGHTLIDRGLFLPESWTTDPQRCQEAGIPPEVIFRSKPDLALEMIHQRVLDKTPFRWIAGDSVYGNSPSFLQGLRELEKWYVVEISSEIHAWTEPPEMRPLGQSSGARGRPTTRQKPLSRATAVHELVDQIPESAWQRISVAQGSQGPRLYEYAELLVWFSEEGVPIDQPERLLVRRSLDQASELKFQRSNAPAEIGLQKLAQVGGCRWAIEQNFQCGKGECGLDEYETRGWIGWHHHTCLSMLALWFLSLQKQRLEKKTSTTDGSRATQRLETSARLERLDGGSPDRTQPTQNASQRGGQTLSRQTKRRGTKRRGTKTRGTKTRRTKTRRTTKV